jgi:hypothetical protein
LFAELKNQIGLRRVRLRRLKVVREQFFLTAAAQNIKRLVRSSANRQHQFCQPPLSRTDEEQRGGVIPSREDVPLTVLFQQPQAITLKNDVDSRLCCKAMVRTNNMYAVVIREPGP